MMLITNPLCIKPSWVADPKVKDYRVFVSIEPPDSPVEQMLFIPCNSKVLPKVAELTVTAGLGFPLESKQV